LSVELRSIVSIEKARESHVDFLGFTRDWEHRIFMKGADALQSELAAENYRCSRPGVEEQPWGARTVTTHDPFGNQLTFTEPTAK
jgi:hypothetical protein